MKLDKEFIRLQKHIERLTKARETTIARNHKKVLDDLRNRLGRLYELYEIDGQLTYDEMLKYNRLQKLDKEVATLINELYKYNTNLIRGHLRGVTEETYTNILDIVNQATGRRIKGILNPLDITKTINKDMAGLTWPERIGKHRSDVIWNIQKEIKQGLTQGDTYGTMTKRLKKELEASTGKANTIVRTESHRVHAQAKEDSFDTIEKAGVQFKEQWLSSKDERVRSLHEALDGVTIDRGEMFVSPSGAMGPGPGLMGSAEDDINCRCIKILVLE